ncbi:MAG TPA: heparinase II/III-family protein [Verrucomicrobiota bacterium]|nr:heparinase II/III-family protein [Verrucomicrobiota bacterium]
MAKLNWYWQRLRAMGPIEVALRLRKKSYELHDTKRNSWSTTDLSQISVFPKLPAPNDAPTTLRESLKCDAERVATGRLRFFGHFDVQTDTPPKWHRDYLAEVDVPTGESAFRLNHRELPDGAAIKPLWEPSRWYGPLRLAQACWLLGNRRSGEHCLEWLEDWVTCNPPYTGWHWTSALESGMRLISFTWIDAFLTTFEGHEPGAFAERLAKLRADILPAHTWFTWRHRTFGSSANNHLLGELCGLSVANARWPDLAKFGPGLAKLGRLVERETLRQFQHDGGNFEQALNYQFFSWEFCLEARQALVAANALPKRSRDHIDERLSQAARFYREVQVPSAPWDYGDSDDAYVMPWFATESKAATEWWHWIDGNATESPFLYLMRGPFDGCLNGGKHSAKTAGWKIFPDTGIGVNAMGYWKARLDFSPLGSGSMAPHGHLDALHFSLWLKGRAMVIDPGTGDYHGTPKLRNWLASHEAHNGPCPDGVGLARREGPFLWTASHPKPLQSLNGEVLETEIRLKGGALLSRTVKPLTNEPEGWMVTDTFERQLGQAGEFTVRWQFAPGCEVERIGERAFRVTSESATMCIDIGIGWALAELWRPSGDETARQLDGSVSPRFMKTEHAPYLKLTAKPGGKTNFTTRFTVA